LVELEERGIGKGKFFIRNLRFQRGKYKKFACGEENPPNQLRSYLLNNEQEGGLGV
jgi:hypothetical protein